MIIRRFLLLVGLFSVLLIPSVRAQKFDFDRLRRVSSEHTLILNITLDLSFGMNNSTDEHRALGTIVTADGLILFDGTFLDAEGNFGSNPGFSVRITPTQIKAHFADGTETSAQYLGLDRNTKFGVAQLTVPKGRILSPVKFAPARAISMGTWVATNSLLPELVNPPLGGNVGMISAVLESPQAFPLTVGLGPNELGSVAYDDRLAPLGIIGFFQDGSESSPFANAQEGEVPMLGLVTAERIARVIANPPGKNERERSWLGITLQALTPDIAEALEITPRAGIIVTEVVASSPAQRGGLKVGDIVTRFNGEAIPVDKEERISIFQRHVAESAPGSTIKLTALRPDGTAFRDTLLAITLEKAPISARDAAEFKDSTLELSVRDLVFGDFVIRNLSANEIDGVVVSSLESGGLAVVGGLQIGDIIQRIGSAPVKSVTDYKQAISTMLDSAAKEIVFFLWRDGRTQFVSVRLK